MIVIEAWRLWLCLAALAACAAVPLLVPAPSAPVIECPGAEALAACREALERDADDLERAEKVCRIWKATSAWYQQAFLRSVR